MHINPHEITIGTIHDITTTWWNLRVSSRKFVRTVDLAELCGAALRQPGRSGGCCAGLLVTLWMPVLTRKHVILWWFRGISWGFNGIYRDLIFDLWGFDEIYRDYFFDLLGQDLIEVQEKFNGHLVEPVDWTNQNSESTMTIQWLGWEGAVGAMEFPNRRRFITP